MQQEAADQKQVDVRAFSTSSRKQMHDILLDWLSMKQIDYSIGFTGWSGCPNPVVKAFPAQKKNKVSTEMRKEIFSSVICHLIKYINIIVLYFSNCCCFYDKWVSF